MRVGLKAVIFATGKSQRRIALEAGLAENRLSEIVRAWVDPTEAEIASLTRVLACKATVFERGAVVEMRSAR